MELNACQDELHIGARYAAVVHGTQVHTSVLRSLHARTPFYSQCHF